MAPVLDVERKSETSMEISTSKEIGTFVINPEEQHVGCASNYADNTLDMEVFPVEQSVALVETEDMELNITECTNSGDTEPVIAQLQDETESSSSFGDTDSGTENGSSLSDAEVESRFVGCETSLRFDGCGQQFQLRKKKLTAHWRKFIRPLMWRCKWIELKIKNLQSQARKYDREIAKYDQRKPFKQENISIDGIGAKSLPYSNQTQTNKLMKRKKRKRIEDTVNVGSYMAQHNLFSYYENQKSPVDNNYDNPVVMTDDRDIHKVDEFGVRGDWSSFRHRDAENSLEEALWKLEVVQTQIRRLRTRVDKVVVENAGKFSEGQLSLLFSCDDALTSAAQNPASPSSSKNRMPVDSRNSESQHLGDVNKGEVAMPESAVSSHGEVAPLLDMTERGDCHQTRSLLPNTEDVLINIPAHEKIHNVEKVIIQPKEKPLVEVEMEELEGTTSLPVPEAGMPLNISLPQENSPLESHSASKIDAPRYKKKRGKRKAGTGKWSRKSLRVT
ncbi:hypothetical protein RJ641_017064 [Dillenia turbinata]|uniref:Uncharacterized protein n=1 Tax=Dillenia turbinata TaxID=194707 RepID=A0AAN8V082_9MAGN